MLLVQNEVIASQVMKFPSLCVTHLGWPIQSILDSKYITLSILFRTFSSSFILVVSSTVHDESEHQYA